MKTLCVLLPVYNAHHCLEPSVFEILEVLPEITDRFELCILDDGSTDDTADAARELAARYPQVKLIRHPVRLGLGETIQTALDNSQAEIVLVGDDDYHLDPDDLRTLWQLRDTQRQMTREAGVSTREQWLEKLLAWKPRHAHSEASSGFQVIRRSVVERFRTRQAAEMVTRVDRAGRPAAMAPLRPSFLGKTSRFAWQE